MAENTDVKLYPIRPEELSNAAKLRSLALFGGFPAKGKITFFCDHFASFLQFVACKLNLKISWKTAKFLEIKNAKIVLKNNAKILK